MNNKFNFGIYNKTMKIYVSDIKPHLFNVDQINLTQFEINKELFQKILEKIF